MIDWIKGKIMGMEKDGRLKQFWEEAQKKSLNKIENPPPVPGIVKAVEAKAWLFDPTKVVGQSITDHLGNIIAPAGQKVNPLDYRSLSKSYVFVDGRDDAQIAFAKKRLTTNPRDKIIFVGGSWAKYSRAWKRQIYYDQGGAITTYFHIQRVPAVLSQKGRLVQIEEIAL